MNPTRVVAVNLRLLRTARGWEQARIATYMAGQEHPWRPVTVSEVERCRRNITVDELVALAGLFDVNVQRLLEPPPVLA